MIVDKYKIGKKKYEIATAEGFFDTALGELKEDGYTQITTQQLAQARMQLGRYNEVSQNGGWVQEGIIFFPHDKDNILIVDGKHNPILQHPTEATNAQRNGEEFYVEADKLRQTATADGKNGVLLLPRSNARYIPVDALADHQLSSFLLGNDAQAYGSFLERCGIEEVPIYIEHGNTEKPFARLLWLGCLDLVSCLRTDYSMELNNRSRVRGVREEHTQYTRANLLRKGKTLGIEKSKLEALLAK